MARAPEFLVSVLGRTDVDSCTGVGPSKRPQVTLTFAQSIDGKIAGKGGKQLRLSGEESMLMTHWMRTMHDAILVGIGTALNDNPQLNARLLPGDQHHLPRPVILDSNLRLRPDCKLLNNYRSGNGRRPWIICSQPLEETEERKTRRETLLRAGANMFEVPSTGDNLHVPAVLEQLHNLGVRSLMVEGGAKIIGTFLRGVSGPENLGTVSLVDNLIITIAPILVGNDGVGYEASTNEGQVAAMLDVRTQIMGRDTVIGAHCR